MRESLQIVALFLGFLSGVTAFISLHNRTWKVSTDYGNVIITSNIFENLWTSCAEDSTGIYDCWDFQSLLVLPDYRSSDMVNAAIEVMAFFLGFAGWVMAAIVIPYRFWKISSIDGNVITASTVYENLWISCAAESTGVHNCREFPSMLGLAGYIQACRALMIASIVLGTIGLVCTLVGMQCSKLGGQNYILKGRIAVLGGVFFILQGMCTMIAVSWYAFNITQEFFDPLYPGIKFEIGEGLYIGWCSAILALIGGACLLCSCGNDNREKLPYPYQSQRRGTDYTTSVMSQQPSHYNRNAYV